MLAGELAASEESEPATPEISAEVVANGLPDRARGLLSSSPSVEALMPRLDLPEVTAAMDRGPGPTLLGHDDDDYAEVAP